MDSIVGLSFSNASANGIKIIGLVATIAIDSPLVIVCSDAWKQLTPSTGPNRAAKNSQGMGFFVVGNLTSLRLVIFLIRKISNKNIKPAKTLWKAWLIPPIVTLSQSAIVLAWRLIDAPIP